MTELRINTSVRRMRTLKVYHLEPSVSVVPCLSSGIAKEGSFSVSLTLSENNKEKKPYSAYIRYKRCVAGSCSAPIVSKGKVSSIVVDTGKSAGAVFDSYVIEAYEKTTAADKILAVVTVSTVRDGVQGSVGPMLVPNGSWDSKRKYRSTDAYRIFVERNKMYFMLHKLNADCLNVDPALDVKNEYWRLMDYIEYMFVNAMVANFGKIASTVFTGDYTISQHGVSKGIDPASGLPYDYKDFTPDMSKFEPNIVINWLTGVIHALSMHIAGDSTFGGQLDGVSGSFRRLVCKDDKGTAVGGISFSAYDDNTNYITIDGNLELNGGDFRHYGEKDGRPLRFLSSNLWCRGNFGAKCRTVAYVTGDTVSYYINGLDKPAVSVTLRAGNYNGRLHREVRLNGVGDFNSIPFDVWGCPIDMVVFNVNKTTYYELVMSDSQRAMVINASNSDGGEVHIYSHGTLVKWVGGDVAEVIKLPNNFLSPSQGVVPGQGLFIGAFRDNNW